MQPRRGLRYKNRPKPAGRGGKAAAAAAKGPASPPPLVHKQLAAVAAMQPAHSGSDYQSEGSSDAEEPSALFKHKVQAAPSPPLPLAAGSMPAAVPFTVPFGTQFFAPSALAAMQSGLTPQQAAAAAAEAFKAVPQLFKCQQMMQMQAMGPAAAMQLQAMGPAAAMMMPWAFMAAPPQAAAAAVAAAQTAAAAQQQPKLESDVQ